MRLIVKMNYSNLIRTKLYKVLLFLFSTILIFPVQAQKKELSMQLDSLVMNIPPEIAYIQTDKDIYEPGEDLWFKVYLLNSQYFTPSLLSKTLYLQLLKEDNSKIFWEEKYEIQNWYSDGRVYISSTVPEGDYILVCYTANSFFEGTHEFYALKRIKIKERITRQSLITAKFNKSMYTKADPVQINFYPSSGSNDSISAEITATLLQGSKKLDKQKVTTDWQGKAVITFPPQEINKELQVDISIKSEEVAESIKMYVPCKGNPIQFSTFPEGGNLVSGIVNKLAFKGVNNNGEPVNIRGTLFEDDAPILDFRSTHAGMGSFDFKPDRDKKYHIRLSEPPDDSTFFLPEIYNSGMTLRIIERDIESLTIIVSQSTLPEGDTIYLRVQCRGVVYDIIKAVIDKEVQIKVPLIDLPQGIAEITLFNSNFEPIAERLVYVNQDQKLNITTELSKEIYSTRDKVELKITVTDEFDNPVMANLGISVFDELYQNPRDSNNILSYFYLTSQLKGRIYNPAYYFDNRNKDREEALDLLMLTQGWRKYIWDEVNRKGIAYAFKQTIFDEIRGEIFNTLNKQNVQTENTAVMVFSPEKENNFEIIKVDSLNKFIIGSTYLKRWENNYIYMKPVGPKGSVYGIRLTDQFETINRLRKEIKLVFPVPDQIQLRKETLSEPKINPDVILIPEVEIRGRKSSSYRGKYLGKLDSLYKLNSSFIPDDKDYVCEYNVLNCPRHRIPYRKPEEGKLYYILIGYGTPAERVKTIFYHRVHKDPNISDEELLKINNLSREKPYYGKRIFYQPKYDQVTEDSMIPDYRNTLLWEPEVFTDKNGEARLSFYCSDINSAFTGRIEGVSETGLLGAGSFNFKVRRKIHTP